VIDLAEWDAAAGASIAVPALAGPDRYVLWVGRADDFHKRPALCLELARRLRNLPFLMILNRANAIIERSIYEQKPASVTILESVPFEQMPVVMSRAAALVSTSAAEYEGAPNVFLQAAASRIPIVSLEASTPMLDAVSPDCVAGGNLERLGDTLVALWHDSERSRQLGSALRRYVEQHHALPVVIEQLRDLLRRVTAAAARV
jgi:glycosyltransferase involved in cell wall biosynthesis